jgi:hypothetical protein
MSTNTHCLEDPVEPRHHLYYIEICKHLSDQLLEFRFHKTMSGHSQRPESLHLSLRSTHPNLTRQAFDLAQ